MDFVRPCVTHSKALRFVWHFRGFSLVTDLFSCWSGKFLRKSGSSLLLDSVHLSMVSFTQTVVDIC